MIDDESSRLTVKWGGRILGLGLGLSMYDTITYGYDGRSCVLHHLPSTETVIRRGGAMADDLLASAVYVWTPAIFC